MKIRPLRPTLACLALALSVRAQPHAGQSPADHLPSYIRHVTEFGERADWSHDGKKVLFLSKTFGDAMEIDLASGAIRNLTQHYPHYGYTRALYLSNGDILLAGPLAYDLKDVRAARNNCYLFILDRSGTKPPTPLGIRCNEGPAVSRTRLHFAWPEWIAPKPGEGNLSTSTMVEADVVYTDGVPSLANKRLVFDGKDLPFRATMETQNYRPPEEKELIFSAYTEGGQKCDVYGVDLATKKLTAYTHSPQIYDEPEGIFPDGRHTLVECDAQHPGGPSYIDLWKLALDGSGSYVRLTHFNDYPGYKASNGVVSDDGRYVAFQMGKSGEAAGIGHGIFILDLARLLADAR